MLVHLSVHNYAIVEHLDLDLKRGMSCISGETGAGKSIMLDARGLTLGDRADSSVVRSGADKADILASFDLDDIPDARTWLAEKGYDPDFGARPLRRVIEKALLNPLAGMLLADELGDALGVRVTVADDGLELTPTQSADVPQNA